MAVQTRSQAILYKTALITLISLLVVALTIARPFVRVMVWPLLIVTLVTISSYFYLMMQSRQPEFSPLATFAISIEPSESVLDFNQQLYASTRYKYFNYRIFAFSRRFDQIESEQFLGLSFRHAMLTKYEPDSK